MALEEESSTGCPELCLSHWLCKRVLLSQRKSHLKATWFSRVRRGGRCLYSQCSEGIGESKASLGYTVARLCQTEMFELLTTKLGKPCVSQNTKEGLRSSCLSGRRIQPSREDSLPSQHSSRTGLERIDCLQIA